MGNEIIKGSYDAIFSLGDLCLGAIQLRKNNLRPFAGPLDWMGTPQLPAVSNLIRNHFQPFMERKDLRVLGYATNEMILVSDEANTVISNHDFDTAKNTLYSLNHYDAVKQKLDRRAHRFMTMLEQANRILFIRTEAALEEILELHQVLSQLVVHDFRILAVNHAPFAGITEKHWPIDKVYAVDLPDNEKWEGNNHLWQQLFEGVELTS